MEQRRHQQTVRMAVWHKASATECALSPPLTDEGVKSVATPGRGDERLHPISERAIAMLVRRDCDARRSIVERGGRNRLPGI